MTLTDIQMGVYTMEGVLHVDDPEHRLVRAILRFTENGVQKSRKNMRGGGELAVTNLEPSTTYELRGEMVFKNERGIRETKPFMETIEVTTKDMSELLPIRFTFQETTEYETERIGIDQIRLECPGLRKESDSPLDFVNKIVVKTGGEDYFVGSSLVRRARKGETVDWRSDAVFQSDRDYSYTIEVQDRFRNQFTLTSDSITSGDTKTCKKAPTAAIKEVSNQVNGQTLSVKITNPDQAGIKNCYLFILNSNGDPVPAFTGLSSEGDARRYPVATDGSETIVSTTQLPAGESFTVVVRGDYDLKDRDTANVRLQEQMGRLALYTAPISRLGYAYVDMTASDATSSSFAVSAAINTGKTSTGLLELMGYMPVQVADDLGNVLYRDEKVISRENLEKIPVASPATAIQIQSADPQTHTPSIVLSADGMEGAANAWEAWKQGGKLTFTFPEGTFASMTSYTASMEAVGIQGGREYQVHAASNQVTVRTMRKAPEFTYRAVFTISDFYELYDFEVKDPDGSVVLGDITMRLYSAGTQVAVRNLSTNQVYESVRFNNLKPDTEYYIEFSTQQYNEGYTAETRKDNHKFDTVYRFKTGEGITGSLEMNLVTVQDAGNVEAKVRVRIEDRKGELKDSKYFLRFYGSAGIDTPDRSLELLEERDFSCNPGTAVEEDVTFPGKTFWKYRVELVVPVGNDELVLDRVTYTTESEMDTIASWDEMVAKINQDPYGKYVVVADIDRPNWGQISQFGGTLDFQGHTLSYKQKDFVGAINKLLDGGVIENLVMDCEVSPVGYHGQQALLVRNNYGAIRNVVANVTLNGRYPHYQISPICYINAETGIIENFVVNFRNNFYIKSVGAGVATHNQGIVRKGYVYGKGITQGSGIYGGNPNDNRTNTGGVVGANSRTGVVEDVYSLIDISMEKSINGMGGVGGVVGYSEGVVRNSFHVGDIYSFEYKNEGGKVEQTPQTPYNAGGGVVGLKGTGSITNCCQISMTEPRTLYVRPYASGETTQRLWDFVWYQGVFGDEDGFLIREQVDSGYYPKLDLPEVMELAQENLSLPPAAAVNAPTYVSNEVVSQSNQSAEMVLYFRNPNNQEIGEIRVDNLTLEILSQGTVEGFYQVRVRAYDPKAYRSAYRLTAVGYKELPTSSSLTYVRYDKEEKWLEADFYREIHEVKDWARMTEAPEDNYILMEDLDFTWESRDDTVIQSQLKGKLDGNGKTVRNVNLPGGYLFLGVDGGQVNDLTFENISLAVTDNETVKGQAMKAGIFASLSNQAELQGITLRDITLKGMPGSVGGLAGEAANSTVKDCRAEGVSITTASLANSPICAGGLVGMTDFTSVSNCYVSGLNLLAKEGAYANGVGGLIGVIKGTGIVSDAYVQGEIQSAFSGVGGAVGESRSALSRIWTYVTIKGNAGAAGGILGRASASLQISSCLVVGDLLSSSQDIGRIYGTVTGGQVATCVSTAAYAGQILGDGTKTEKADANHLLDGAYLNRQDAYRNEARLGNSFDIAGMSGYAVEQGYMPMLKDSRGELFADQTPVLRRDERLKILGSSLTQNGDDTYTLQIETAVGDSGYRLDRVESEGFALGEGKVQDSNNGPLIRYEQAKPSQYLGLYTFQVYFEKDGVYQVLPVQIEKILYRTIYNAEQWVSVMQQYGQNYENFELGENIHLETIKDQTLIPANLKIGSIQGRGYAISGMTLYPEQDGEAMIHSVTGDLSDLTFRNITVDNEKNKVSGNYIGVIGTNQGTIERVNFENIKVNGYNASYVGCIGNNAGPIHDVTLTDIRIESNSGNYVGGLAGYTSGPISKVEAVGTGKVAFKVGQTKPQQSEFTYQVVGKTKNDYVGGIVGFAGADLEDISIQGAYIQGRTFVAGIMGQNYEGNFTDLRVGAEDAPVSVNGSTRVGGVTSEILSTPQYKTASLSQVQVTHSYISAVSSVGGIADGNWYLNLTDSKISDSWIKGSGEYIGGAVGQTGDMQQVLVQDCLVEGGALVGGLTGSSSAGGNFNAVMDTTVTGTKYVGGLAGWYDSATSPRLFNVVAGCTVGNKGAQYVGGAFGTKKTMSNLYQIYVGSSNKQRTTVTAETYAGGFAGEIKGGGCYEMVCDADVTAVSNAGAFTGVLYDFFNDPTSMNSRPNPFVRNVILAGSVKADTTAGAFAGLITRDEPKMDMNGNIIGEGNDYLDVERYNALALTSNVTCGDHQVGLFGYFTDNQKQNSLPKAINTIQTFESSNKRPWIRVFNGMKIAKADGTSWNIMERLKTDYGYQDYAAAAGVEKQKLNLLTEADFKNQQDRAVYWNMADGYLDYSGLDRGCFPYLTARKIGGAAMYQGTMVDYQNGKYGPGVKIPTGSATFELADQEEEKLLTAYPSGADTINLELAAGLYGINLTVSDGSGEILKTVAEERVYTMPYNFSSPLQATLSWEGGEISYDLDPMDLIRTVMNWNGEYYYLTNSGVRDSEGLVLEGNFLHLYQGTALDVNGVLWDVETGQQTGKQDFSEIAWQETKPFGEFGYGGRNLTTYGKFTQSETNGTAVDLEDTLYVKGGQIFALDPGSPVVPGALVADSLGDGYFTVLGNDGVLHDMASGIHTPEGFENQGIRELADNLSSDLPVAIGRYKNGTAFAFNYLTGTALPLEEAERVGEDQSLADYAGQWIEAKLGSWFGFNSQGYRGSMNMIQDLESGKLGRLDDILGRPSGSTTPEGLLDTSSDSGDLDGSGDSDDSPDSSNSDVKDSGKSGDTDEFKDTDKSGDVSGAASGDSGKSGDADGSVDADKSGAADGSKDADRSGVTDDSGDSGKSGAADGSGESGNADLSGSGDKSGDVSGESGDAGLGGSGDVSGQSQAAGQSGNAGQSEVSVTQTGTGSGETTGVAGNSGAGAGTGEAGNAGSDGDAATGEKTGAENGQSQTDDQAEELISVYNAKTGEYEIYPVDEFLSKPKSQLTSVNERLKDLAMTGVVTGHGNLDVLDTREFVDQNKYGLIVFGGTSVAILSLVVWLVTRKRKSR
ncbi:MAG: GLUG motif-containing protein [Lachnospiraceae bacterium]